MGNDLLSSNLTQPLSSTSATSKRKDFALSKLVNVMKGENTPSRPSCHCKEISGTSILSSEGFSSKARSKLRWNPSSIVVEGRNDNGTSGRNIEEPS